MSSFPYLSTTIGVPLLGVNHGRVGFLDFGLMRTLDKDYLEAERALARAVVAEDAEEVHAILTRLGYLPNPDDFVPEALLEWLLAAGEWYLQSTNGSNPSGGGFYILLPNNTLVAWAAPSASARWSPTSRTTPSTAARTSTALRRC